MTYFIRFIYNLRIVVGLLIGIWIGMLYQSTPVEAEEMEQKQSQVQERFIKADGKVLRDRAGTGDIITLRGTNAGGWQVMEAWMCPTNSPDQETTIAVLTERFGEEKMQELLSIYEEAWWQEQDFDNVKELDFNVLRLPISCYNLLDNEGILREDTLATIDWFVTECEKRGIYVILDLHAAPGSQNGRDHSGDSSGSVLFSDEKAGALTISLWEQLARHYAGNATIAGYDLLNEPEGDEEERSPWGKTQLPFLDRLYQAIRAIDEDHLIIMNAIWEPTDIPDPTEYGWENVMYEYHFYGWDGINDPKAQNAFTNSKVVKNKQAGHEVPVLVGEFTLFERIESWEHALRTYEENGWSWTTWTYKTVNMGSWGIYNSTLITTPKVDIYQDTEVMIADKWSKAATVDSFKVNKPIYDVLKKWAGRTEADAAAELSSEDANQAEDKNQVDQKADNKTKKGDQEANSDSTRKDSQTESRNGLNILLVLAGIFAFALVVGFTVLYLRKRVSRK
jgi:aryl-phospho-beta-D-glucosidase BglC (GH1 family)